MKILAVSDQVLPSIYSHRLDKRHADTDMVIGCGDLPYYYLEFITTKLMVPVVYVHGNHDKPQLMADGRVVDRAEGCILIDGEVETVDGVVMAGLGGSMRYQPRAKHQYTEQEMWWRIIGLMPRLFLNRARHGRFMDFLVTHSPPYGIHDGKDLPHRGFKSLLTVMRLFKPSYMLHGHKHVYRRDTTRETVYHETTVINVYPQRVINWEGVGTYDRIGSQEPEGIGP